MVDENIINQAAHTLLHDGLVAFPTETVYGLGANALSDIACKKIFEVKGRPSNNPLIVHVATIELATQLVHPEAPAYIKLRLNKLSAFWPGPLSVIVPKNEKISNFASAGGPNIAIRIPDNQIALQLITAANIPIAAPSANLSGRLSPTQASHVEQSLGNLIDIIIDGGPCKIGIESTVIGIFSETPIIFRPGAISLEQIEEALEEKVIYHNSKENLANNQSLVSPGLLSSHYAPKTPLFFSDQVNSNEFMNKKTARIVLEESNLSASAAKLFATLHDLDSKNLDAIIIDRIPETGLGLALMDRLKRAVSRID
jgi:L-threonylcarbamoyladenylate synthase